MSDAVDSIGKTALQTAMSTTQIGNGFFLKRTAGPEDSVKYLALVTAWLKRKFLVFFILFQFFYLNVIG